MYNLLQKQPTEVFTKACNCIKKSLWHTCFSREFCEISKNIFFIEHLLTAASVVIWICVFSKFDLIGFSYSVNWICVLDLCIFSHQKTMSNHFQNKILKISTVDLDCDLEKISRKLKFGIDVPYTFRIHQKKVPTHSTLRTAKIHNGGFTAFFFILI